MSDEKQISISTDRGASTALEESNSITQAKFKGDVTAQPIEEEKDDVDEAYQFMKDNLEEYEGEMDPKEVKKVLRKIDWHILPWLFMLYGLQFLDKQMLSYSSIMGLYEDCNIDSDTYSWISSLYYIGYLVAAYPHNRLLQKFNQVKYIAVMTVFWSVTLMCMAAASNAAGLYVTRILMGVFESAVATGFVLIISKWYKTYEQATRTGFWTSSIGFFSMIGSLVAFGAYMGGKESNSSLSSWRVMVLCVGASSLLFGIFMFLFMSDSPLSAKFLNHDEKVISIRRLKGNQQGIGNHKFKKDQFIETLLDYRTWLYVVIIFTSQIPGGGTSSFAAQLISSYGWSTQISLLLTSLPDGFIETFTNTLFGKFADWTGLRSMTCIAAQLACLITVCVQIGLQEKYYTYEKYVQLLAYYFMNGFIDIAYTLLLSFVSSNTAGYTKKTTTNAIVIISFSLSYFIGPHVFNDGPYYHTAKKVCLILWCISILLFGLQWYLNWRENKLRDEMFARGEIEEIEGIEFLDLTDKQNKMFRYVL